MYDLRAIFFPVPRNFCLYGLKFSDSTGRIGSAYLAVHTVLEVRASERPSFACEFGSINLDTILDLDSRSRNRNIE